MSNTSTGMCAANLTVSGLYELQSQIINRPDYYCPNDHARRNLLQALAGIIAQARRAQAALNAVETERIFADIEAAKAGR